MNISTEELNTMTATNDLGPSAVEPNKAEDSGRVNVSSSFLESTDDAKKISMLDEEENYPEPETLQEELNAILEAFFEMVSEDDIQAYQRYVEDIQGARIAEQALMEPAMAPTFELEDQDGDRVSLPDLLQKGPVVLIFYRGKWCPHCNATLMRYSKELVPALEPYNATLVAISPMLPDGTAFLATKRDFRFSVCSDPDNQLAKQFGISFTVQPHSRPYFKNWGEDVPEHTGVDSWDIPLPATYIIAPNGQIAWSFLDNDPGIRAEVPDIVEQVAQVSQEPPKERARGRPKLYNRKIASTFTFGMKAPKLKFWRNQEDMIMSDESYDGGDSARFSVHSDGAVIKKEKNSNDPLSTSQHSSKSDGPRRKQSKRRKAAAFLGRYVIRDGDSP
jgi:peroxiredoxin